MLRSEKRLTRRVFVTKCTRHLPFCFCTIKSLLYLLDIWLNHVSKSPRPSHHCQLIDSSVSLRRLIYFDVLSFNFTSFHSFLSWTCFQQVRNGVYLTYLRLPNAIYLFLYIFMSLGWLRWRRCSSGTSNISANKIIWRIQVNAISRRTYWRNRKHKVKWMSFRM